MYSNFQMPKSCRFLQGAEGEAPVALLAAQLLRCRQVCWSDVSRQSAGDEKQSTACLIALNAASVVKASWYMTRIYSNSRQGCSFNPRYMEQMSGLLCMCMLQPWRNSFAVTSLIWFWNGLNVFQGGFSAFRSEVERHELRSSISEIVLSPHPSSVWQSAQGPWNILESHRIWLHNTVLVHINTY